MVVTQQALVRAGAGDLGRPGADGGAPPYFGWLANSPSGYPDTRGLAVDVVTTKLELRPQLVLHDADHPLVHQQRDGITLDRVRRIAELNLH